MADAKISALTSLTGAGAAQNDLLAIVDIAELPFDKEKYLADQQEKKKVEEQTRQAELLAAQQPTQQPQVGANGRE